MADPQMPARLVSGAGRSRIGAGSADKRFWTECRVLSQKYEHAIPKEEACLQTDVDVK
jgi:hypothetical protein